MRFAANVRGWIARALSRPLALAVAAGLGVSLTSVALWSGAGATGPAPARAATLMPVAPPTHMLPHGLACDWPTAGSNGSTPFGQGTYVEPGRTQHVGQYRLRVDDVVELVFRRTHEETGPYQLNVGDKLRIELPPAPLGGETVNREVVIQPDGNITLPNLDKPVRAARLTIEGLAATLAEKYREIFKEHMAKKVTVTPILIDAKLADLINTVDSRAGTGGQVRTSRVTPDGSIALPAIGSVPVIGLTLDELKIELSQRYLAADVRGIEVQPVLQTRAPRHVFVLGEVRTPGRYPLDGPTTVIQAITLAGGVTGAGSANLKQTVIFRRTQDWQMIATMVNLYEPIINGVAECPAVNDLWVADADIVIVPKTKILVFDEFINLVFSRGVYGVLPMQGITIGFAKTSSL